MWRALIKMKDGDDEDVVSFEKKITWRIILDADILYVEGDFDELGIPMDRVKSIRLYRMGKPAA